MKLRCQIPMAKFGGEITPYNHVFCVIVDSEIIILCPYGRSILDNHTDCKQSTTLYTAPGVAFQVYSVDLTGYIFCNTAVADVPGNKCPL